MFRLPISQNDIHFLPTFFHVTSMLLMHFLFTAFPPPTNLPPFTAAMFRALQRDQSGRKRAVKSMSFGYKKGPPRRCGSRSDLKLLLFCSARSLKTESMIDSEKSSSGDIELSSTRRRAVHITYMPIPSNSKCTSETIGL